MPEMTLTRRSFLRTAGLTTGVTGLAVAGCAPTVEPDTVTWSMWSNGPTEQEVWDAFSDFVESELGQRSLVDLTPSGGYVTRMDLQLVSGTQRMVHGVNGWLLPTYAGRGALLPLDDLIAGDSAFDHDDFFPAIRDIATFNGQTYGIGFDVAPTVLYVNLSLFEANGIAPPDPTVPMSWEEFRDLASAFSAQPDQYGFSCAPSLDDLVSWLYCAGGNVMNEEQSISTLHTAESMHALEFMVGLFTREKVTPPISNLVTTDSLAQFLDGNVAMMQNGPWQVLNVRNADFEWDVVPFPAGPVGSTPRLSGSVFGIPSATRDVELAWQLLTTLTSTGALDIYARAGRNNPARASASSAFAPPPDNLGVVQRILAGEIAGGHQYDVTTNWNEVRNLLAQELPRAFLGQRTPAEVIDSVRPRLDVLMSQNTDNIRQLRAG
ncbi:ABC transporter substrate-binding protein [Pseudactinotalea sp.]|uniref:ABC transporter substrate-binding protein n=1 Tax=Pseudactinotalea sp. TaxID=1926260 RepID=UPI003B3B67DF